MMIKRRIDEDFKHVWAINWNGLPEDFSDATEIVLTASVYGKKKQLERGIDYVIEGNLIIVDFTPRFVTIPGIYNLELKYIKPSDGFFDGERRSAIDLDVVQIVARSSQVTDTGDITSTSEAAFGFQGLSAYEVWLKDNPDKTKEDYYNWLRQPATDAVSLIDDKIEHLDEIIDSSTENEAERVSAETLRLQSEEIRISAETERKANEVERLANEASRASDELIRKANESTRKQDEATRKTNENEREISETIRVSNENNRVTAEQARVNAESLRATAESSRESAESLRVEAELLRQTSTQEAISNAENATENANTAAQNADDARVAIQSDLGAKAFHGYASIEVAKTLKQVEDNASVRVRNLITNGDFRNGLNGWTLLGEGTASVSNNLAVITGTGIGAVVLSQNTEHEASSKDKIYFNAKRKRNVSENFLFLRIENRSGSGFIATDIGSPLGEYIYDSILITLPESWGEGKLRFRYQHYFNTGVSNLGISSEIGNIVIVNLTKTFGAGNEPTKEEFELLLDILGTDYFEGEITIPAQKIMQWQLNLIRKNKNAIIALGGTII